MDDRTTAHVRRTTILALAVLVAALTLLGLAAAAGAASPPASITLPEPAFTGPLAGDARAALGAPQPGSGGWIWPIGTEDFQGWSGWLDPRGSYVHVAQDMPCSYGHAVYAIGDGVVFISRADAGGYGVGGAPGGCIIITHTTAAGTKFHALYGHVCGLKVKAGQRVQAGQVIARVNGCKHLHFSTHPGAKYRDGNPYAGHVPKSWADHGGYVDPVKFLKTNPRAAAYMPPALPRTEIATTSAPLQYGAADGAAYWTEEGGAGSVTWRYDLATRRAQDARRGRGRPGLRRAAVRRRTARRAGARLRGRRPPSRRDARGGARHAAVGRRGRAHRAADQCRRRAAAGSDRQAAAAQVRLAERGARRHRRGRRGRLPLRAGANAPRCGWCSCRLRSSRTVATTSSRAAGRGP